MKILVIIFILFLLLILLFLKIPKTGEFVQTEKEPSRINDEKWKFIGRVQIENGRVVSMNFTDY